MDGFIAFASHAQLLQKAFMDAPSAILKPTKRPSADRQAVLGKDQKTGGEAGIRTARSSAAGNHLFDS